MPTFKPRTRAAKGEGLTQALDGELAAYEKVGLFTRAINSRSAYRYRGVLLQYQKALGGSPPTLEASRRFLARLRQDGFKASTLRLYRAALGGFHAWRGEQLVFPVKVPRHLPRYRSAELVDSVLALAEGKPRDHVILRLMSDGGLRRGEVISLRVRDVDLTGRMMCVRGKGDRDRVVPLTEELHEQLGQACQGKALDDTVVGVKEKAVYQVVKKYGALAGEPNLHPHDLRHAFATRLVEGNANIRAVQELLGHADLTTTAVYLGVVPKHLKQAIQILGKGSGNSGRPSPAEPDRGTSSQLEAGEKCPGEDKGGKASDIPKELAQRLVSELDEQISPLKSFTSCGVVFKAQSDAILTYSKQRFADWEGWRLLNEVKRIS